MYSTACLYLFRGTLTVFTVLCEQYQPSLRREPMYNEVRVNKTLLDAQLFLPFIMWFFHVYHILLYTVCVCVCVWMNHCLPVSFTTLSVCPPLSLPLDVSLAPQYLDRIGQLFFGVPPKQSPSYGGLLGEWRNTLFISAQIEDYLHICFYIKFCTLCKINKLHHSYL